MSKVQLEQRTQLPITLIWREHLHQDKRNYPHWHGYTVDEVASPPRVILYLEPNAKKREISSLRNAVATVHHDWNIEVVRISQFRQVRNKGAAAVRAARAAVTIQPRASSAPGPVQLNPGESICTCGCRHPGTLGAYLKGKDGDVWLLTNSHVLLPSPSCPANMDVLSAAGVAVGTNPQTFQIQRLGNRVDVGIAKIKNVASPSNASLGLAPSSTSVALSTTSTITKIGAATGSTSGRFVGLTTMEIGDPEGASHEFVDQLLIHSESGKEFVKPGDSGSLAVSNGKAVGLIFAIPGKDPNLGPTADHNPKRFALANPFNEVMDAVSQLAGEQLQLL